MKMIGRATCILEHLIPGRYREALAGDLLQEHRDGRSVGWYWRQILTAITIGWFRAVFSQRAVLVFALLWSVLAPGWNVWIEKADRDLSLSSSLWKLDWPWSLLCSVGVYVSAGMVFVLCGVLIYLLPQLGIGCISFRRIGRGIRLSLSTFAAVSTGILALTLLVPSSNHVFDKLGIIRAITPDGPHYFFDGKGIYDVETVKREIDGHTGKVALIKSHIWKVVSVPGFGAPIRVNRTPVGEIRNVNLTADIARLPYFLSLLVALCPLRSSLETKTGER
jgi:hypothetical protein